MGLFDHGHVVGNKCNNPYLGRYLRPETQSGKYEQDPRCSYALYLPSYTCTLLLSDGLSAMFRPRAGRIGQLGALGGLGFRGSAPARSNYRAEGPPMDPTSRPAHAVDAAIQSLNLQSRVWTLRSPVLAPVLVSLDGPHAAHSTQCRFTSNLPTLLAGCRRTAPAQLASSPSSHSRRLLLLSLTLCLSHFEGGGKTALDPAILDSSSP